MASNQFVNDGSFMELFRKRMEEQQKAKEAAEKTQAISTQLAPHQKRQEDRTGSRTAEGKTERETEELEKRTERSTAEPKSKPYQGVTGVTGITGKRKALAKSIEIREKRKRRREEMEEQQQAEEEASKNSAWKAYMAEVKAYEARSCSDQDGHKRPLVK